MRLLKLTIENYKSFETKTELYFDEGVCNSDRNVFLIGGMNGAGKTSILEAINAALYGDNKKHISESMNRNSVSRGQYSCCIELMFQTDKNEVIIVRRSWNGNMFGSPLRPDDLEEKLVVFKDGQKISVAHSQEWQDYINTMMPREITRFFFFDGEKIQEMAADEHAELKLKSSMEAALGVGLVRQLVTDLEQLHDELRRSRTDVSDEDIQLKENSLKALKRKSDKLLNDRQEAVADVSELENKRDEARKKFTSLFGFEPAAIEEGKLRERKKIQLSNQVNEIESQIRAIAERSLALALLADHFNIIQTHIEAEADFRRYEAVRRNATDLAHTITHQISTPTTICCNTVLSAEQHDGLREKIANAILAFGLTQDGSQISLPVLHLSEAEAQRISDRIEIVETNWNGDINRLLGEWQSLDKQLKEIEWEIKRTSVAEGDTELFQRIQQEIEGLCTQIGRKKEELQHFDSDLADLKEDIESAQRDLGLLYQKHKGSAEHEKLVTRISKVKTLMTEYVDELRRAKISQLQSKTSEMYKRLAHKGDLISQIEIDEETYVVTIRDHKGKVVLKQNLSAGEKEVFAISLLWGLARTSQLELPIIVDTPLSRLDSTHRDRIVSAYFPSAGHQVVVLSTDTEVDQDYNRQLEPHLQHAIHLVFDKASERTEIEDGYFWR